MQMAASIALAATAGNNLIGSYPPGVEAGDRDTMMIRQPARHETLIVEVRDSRYPTSKSVAKKRPISKDSILSRTK